MRVLLVLLIVLCTVPCYATAGRNIYVNAGDANARNQAGYGTAPTTPVITPSYATANLLTSTDSALPDTVYIYGYSVTGDTSNYYQDVILISDKFVNFIGISVDGDSPTFGTYTGLKIYPSAVISNLQSANSGLYIGVNGIAFRNIVSYSDAINSPGVIRIQSNNKQDSYVFADVRNCLFYNINADSTTPRFAALSHREYISAAGVRGIFNIYNNSFVNCAIVYAPAPRQGPYNIEARMNNCTIRNTEYLFFPNDDASLGTIGSDTLYMTNCIIDSAANINITTGRGSHLSAFYMSYTDSYNSVMSTNADGGNNNYHVEPLWEDVLTDTYSAYAYLQSGASSSITGGSTTGGLIGVLWGYPDTDGPDAATTRRVPFCTRWWELLL